jgi:Rod binding domain-containing protein
VTRITGSGPGGPASISPDAALRRTSQQLEGVFVAQLFKVMRETVGHDGYVDGGAGEDMFTGLFDEKIAEAAPQQWHDGLAASIYRQLADRLPQSAAPGSDAALDASITRPDITTRP